MCEWVSWLETPEQKILFLTDSMMKTREKDMEVKYPDKSERCGHGAIRWYFDVTEGTEKECVDFRMQSNFPEVIAKAIKQGKLSYGVTPEIAKLILTPEALADYEAKRAPLDADYEAKRDALFSKLVKFKKNRNNNWK